MPVPTSVTFIGDDGLPHDHFNYVRGVADAGGASSSAGSNVPNAAANSGASTQVSDVGDPALPDPQTSTPAIMTWTGYPVPGQPAPTSGGSGNDPALPVPQTPTPPTTGSTGNPELSAQWHAPAIPAPEASAAVSTPQFLVDDHVLNFATPAASGGVGESNVEWGGSPVAGSVGLTEWSTHSADDAWAPISYGHAAGDDSFLNSYDWSWLAWDSGLHKITDDWFVV